ncbi:MAG: hypothetical protein H3C47_12250 [Candidatus Cloacimonetes bacterium]|nr:hypothetical protein [Candidatus Cloacimonadota bacterium]
MNLILLLFLHLFSSLVFGISSEDLKVSATVRLMEAMVLESHRYPKFAGQFLILAKNPDDVRELESELKNLPELSVSVRSMISASDEFDFLFIHGITEQIIPPSLSFTNRHENLKQGVFIALLKDGLQPRIHLSVPVLKALKIYYPLPLLRLTVLWENT